MITPRNLQTSIVVPRCCSLNPSNIYLRRNELRPALVTTIAYLLGSIPFGYLIVRTAQGSDIRDTGSGGTGATNASRQAGKGAGPRTLNLDAVKGAVAVLVAKVLSGLPSVG